jgi:hypothetical protein
MFATGFFEGTDGRGGFETVHFGHLDVHEGDIKTMQRCGDERFPAVECGGNDVIAFRKHAARNHLVHGVVLEEEDF